MKHKCQKTFVFLLSIISYRGPRWNLEEERENYVSTPTVGKRHMLNLDPWVWVMQPWLVILSSHYLRIYRRGSMNLWWAAAFSCLRHPCLLVMHLHTDTLLKGVKALFLTFSLHLSPPASIPPPSSFCFSDMMFREGKILLLYLLLIHFINYIQGTYYVASTVFIESVAQIEPLTLSLF